MVDAPHLTPELTLFLFSYDRCRRTSYLREILSNKSHLSLPTYSGRPSTTMSKTFSKDDVASHSKGDSLWIVIDEDVYDVTKFQDEHPGECRSPQRAMDGLWSREGPWLPLGCVTLPGGITCADLVRIILPDFKVGKRVSHTSSFPATNT